MTRSPMVAFAFAAFTLACAPSAWAANTITAITPEANRVVLVDGKAMVRFTVSGQGNEQGDCGIWVNYGDQDSPDTRVIGRREGMFPREFVHTFGRAGQFTVTAKGDRVKQVFGCEGGASATVTVIEQTRFEPGRAEPPGGRRRTAAAGCPSGWELREGSFVRESGAFVCVPSYPQEPIECGPGLRYFESDNLIGCRTRGGNQRDRQR